MQNLTKIALFVWVVLFIPSLALCQTSLEAAPYKTMNMKFVLEGTPSPEDAGFKNSKSFWQFRYELRFLKEPFKFQYFAEKSGESQKERSVRIYKNNKDHDKGWRKNSVLVARGMIGKTSLLSVENREITIPVELTPEIVEFLAKAGNTWQNPDFRISLKGKVSIRADSILKFKQKVARSFVCPTKIQTKTAQYWVTNTCGISIEIRKREDGKLSFGWVSRI